eukprot:scaffold1160_cov157-Isochrysis_galbana.AAC.3
MGNRGSRDCEPRDLNEVSEPRVPVHCRVCIPRGVISASGIQLHPSMPRLAKPRAGPRTASCPP